MTWTIKKDFRGAVLINSEQTGAIELRERDDHPYAVISAKYGAFELSERDMYAIGKLLMAFGESDMYADEDVLKWSSIVFAPKTPIEKRQIELPKREDGCVALEGEHAIENYIKKGESDERTA